MALVHEQILRWNVIKDYIEIVLAPFDHVWKATIWASNSSRFWHRIKQLVETRSFKLLINAYISKRKMQSRQLKIASLSVLITEIIVCKFRIFKFVWITK